MELIPKIYQLRNDFIRKYNIKPNTVYMDISKFHDLKNYAIYSTTLWDIKPEHINAMSILGMGINIMHDNNYLSVGLEIQHIGNSQ